MLTQMSMPKHQNKNQRSSLKASRKRWVFRFDLKADNEVMSRRRLGRPFQTSGATIENILLSVVLFLLHGGGSSRLSELERVSLSPARFTTRRSDR